MKKFFSFTLVFFSMLIFTNCASNSAPEPITWGLGPYSIQSLYKSKPSVYSYDKYSTLSVSDQEVNGAVCDIMFDFEDNALISVKCTYKEYNADDQKNTYSTVKSAVSTTFGEPSISDEIRKTDTDYTEYRYTEWSDDVTKVQLSYNLRYTDEYNVILTYYSQKTLDDKELKKQQETQIVQEKGDDGYLNYTKWTLQTPYAFAVEISDYDGDVFSAGEYIFSTSNTKLGEAPIYDVYIKEREYAKISELGVSDFSVGGAKALPITYTLKKGDYVYIVPYTKLVYEPKGYLEIKK